MGKQKTGGTPRLGAVRGFAGGGTVEPSPTSFRGLFNSARNAISNALAPETPEQGAARRAAEYADKKAKYDAKQAAQAAAATTPASAPSGVNLGIDGAGGNSVDRRLKEAGAYANGGMVNGLAVEKRVGAFRRGGTVKKKSDPVAKKPTNDTEPDGDESGQLMASDQDGDEQPTGEGFKIQGPGTATSDSIDGEVVETGEPIRVANGERILSVDQEKYMQGVAKKMGHPSVDAMLERGTGKPVGPTTKFVPAKPGRGAMRMRGAANGMELNGRSNPIEQMQQMGDPSLRVGQIQYQDNAIPKVPPPIQRSGMGLPGYNPALQGQTVSVPSNGGNADPMKEPVPTFKCGGKIKGFDSGGRIELDPAVSGYGPNTTEGMGARRAAYEQQLANAQSLADSKTVRAATPNPPTQIPAPQPAAQVTTTAAAERVPGDGTMSYGEQMRNLGNALAGAPVEAIKTLVSAPGYGMNKQEPPAANTTTQRAPAAPATPAAAPAYPSESTRAPAVNAPVPAAAGAVRKTTDMGNGITRIDDAGKSPLFTNLAGGADNPSNVALMNRGAVTPQNMAAADALAGRYQREAQNTNQAAANTKQMADETAQAQRANAAGSEFERTQAARIDGDRARWGAESKLASRLARPEEKQAALKRLTDLDAIERDQYIADRAAPVVDAQNRLKTRELDIQDQRNTITDRHERARGAIDKAKLGIDQSKEAREAGTFAQQQAKVAEINRLMQSYETAPTHQREAIAEQIRVLQGRDKAEQWGAVPGERNADGTQAPPVIYNKATGALAGNGAAPLPPGMVKQVGTSGGRPVYEDKSGKKYIQ